MAMAPMWHGGPSSAKGSGDARRAYGHPPAMPRVKADFLCFAAKMQLHWMRLTPVFRRTMARMRLFYVMSPFMPGRGGGVICSPRGGAASTAKPGSFRVARTIASRGKSADDGERYNPTLLCANRDLMLFRMNRNRIRFCPRQGGGNREGKNFFIWIRCNPLKSPESAKEIQGNASVFAWFYLDLLGFIWPPRRTRVSAPLRWQPRRRTGQSRRSSPQAGRTAARGGRLRE